MLGRPRGRGALRYSATRAAGGPACGGQHGDGFARLLADEDLLLDLGQLTYWSHWITPARERKRFDTRFFAVEVPADQDASADLSELTHHAWLTRAKSRSGMRSGELRLAPPTQRHARRHLAEPCAPRQHRRDAARRAGATCAAHPAENRG